MIKEILEFKADSKTIWNGEHKIPWNERGFSERMLKEHLSQAHDMASRRQEIIEDQVHWIHETILQKKPSRLLDLGCGPGFHINKLSQLGHHCTGIDFSPASVDYACSHCTESHILLGDIRQVEYGNDFDIVMLLFGELNAFSPEESMQILHKAYTSLKQGGILLVEVSLFDPVKKNGSAPSNWYRSAEGGISALFSDKPHLGLVENNWFEDAKVARSDYWILEEGNNNLHHYVNTLQAYTDPEYVSLLKQCHFQDIAFCDNYGKALSEASEFQVISAIRK